MNGYLQGERRGVDIERARARTDAGRGEAVTPYAELVRAPGGPVVAALGPGGEQHAGRIRDFNVDCEGRDARAAIHPHLDVLAFNGDVLGDRG